MATPAFPVAMLDGYVGAWRVSLRVSSPVQVVSMIETEVEVGKQRLAEAEAKNSFVVPNDEKLYLLFRDTCKEQKIGTYKYKVRWL